MDKRTQAAYEFFRDHSGWVNGRRAVNALALAKAEEWARDNDVSFAWEWDEDPDLSWCETCEHFRECGSRRRYIRADERGCHDCTHRAHRTPHADHEVLGCVAKGPDGIEASLWGITDPDRNYRRVIEAEMAVEVRGQVDDATAEAAGLADMYARHFAE